MFCTDAFELYEGLFIARVKPKHERIVVRENSDWRRLDSRHYFLRPTMSMPPRTKTTNDQPSEAIVFVNSMLNFMSYFLVIL